MLQWGKLHALNVCQVPEGVSHFRVVSTELYPQILGYYAIAIIHPWIFAEFLPPPIQAHFKHHIKANHTNCPSLQDQNVVP